MGAAVVRGWARPLPITVAPIRAGGSRAGLRCPREGAVLCLLCPRWSRRAGTSSGTGTGGSARLSLAERDKGIEQGLCLFRQGVRKGSSSHPCPAVLFPKGVPPCHCCTCLGKVRGANITCYSAELGARASRVQVELEDYVSAVMLLREKRSG